jgi:hypothetical protein
MHYGVPGYQKSAASEFTFSRLKWLFGGTYFYLFRSTKPALMTSLAKYDFYTNFIGSFLPLNSEICQELMG